jgi:hypothetical protein
MDFRLQTSVGWWVGGGEGRTRTICACGRVFTCVSASLYPNGRGVVRDRSAGGVAPLSLQSETSAQRGTARAAAVRARRGARPRRLRPTPSIGAADGPGPRAHAGPQRRSERRRRRAPHLWPAAVCAMCTALWCGPRASEAVLYL